ncbi:MAG: sulfotransferase [Hyphomonadaceae bacterium]
MQRDPEADRATLRAMQEAAQGGNLPRAADMAEAALADGLHHPLAFNLAALKREMEGRLEEAVTLLRRAVEIAPQDPGARNALGLCLLRLGEAEEALFHLDALLALRSDFAPAHASRGAALEMIGIIDAAQAAYSHALSADPGNIAALAGAASVYARRGQYGEARAAAEQVLKQAPHYPDAAMSLAAAALGENNASKAETLMRTLLADARTAPAEAARAEGRLGDALDALGRTAEAFDAYQRGNSILIRLHAERYGKPPTTLDSVRWQIEYFERARPDGLALRRSFGPAKGQAAGHVFLLGFPRSGTTLLEQVLASHPNVVALEERETLIDSTRAFLRGPAELDKLFAANERELASFRDAYWARARDAGISAEGVVFVDKHPLNTLKLPLIAQLFPEAKIIFARRDPRDVVLSCFRRQFRMSAPYYQMLSLETAAAFYDATMTLGARVSEELALDMRSVTHEKLVAAFEEEVNAICDFIGVTWSDEMRNFATRVRDRSVSTPSGVQLSRGLSAEGIGAWRRYERHLQPVMGILDKWVRAFGYAT